MDVRLPLLDIVTLSEVPQRKKYLQWDEDFERNKLHAAEIIAFQFASNVLETLSTRIIDPYQARLSPQNLARFKRKLDISEKNTARWIKNYMQDIQPFYEWAKKFSSDVETKQKIDYVYFDEKMEIVRCLAEESLTQLLSEYKKNPLHEFFEFNIKSLQKKDSVDDTEADNCHIILEIWLNQRGIVTELMQREENKRIASNK
jgi:hypothetical protein